MAGSPVYSLTPADVRQDFPKIQGYIRVDLHSKNETGTKTQADAGGRGSTLKLKQTIHGQ